MKSARYTLLPQHDPLKRKVPLYGMEPGPLGGDGTTALGDGRPTFFPISCDPERIAGVWVRKQVRARIVNGWLILIALLGAIIALADGLTRTPIAEHEAAWNGPLQYEPYAGALWLACLSFPLMFAYLRAARVSLREGLFLWFVFCTAAYTRDFSYLRWPGVPLFITDLVLLILLLSIYLLPERKSLRAPILVALLLISLAVAGVVAAVRGFLGHRDIVFIGRDLALVVYPLFLLVAHHVLRSWLSIKRLAVWLAMGTALSVMNGFAWFLAAPQERRFIYYGTYILIALVGTFVASTQRLIPARAGWILAGLFCLGLALANARSLYVSLFGLIVTGLCGLGVVRGKIFWARTATTLAAAAALIGTMAFLFLRTDAGRDLAERSAQELSSGVLDSGEDLNWQFRLSAWKEAWRRFEEYPLAGEGFGIPFVFDVSPFDNDPRPHNTFLTVLYKMGLLGFLPMVSLLAYFFWIALHAVHRNVKSERVGFLWVVVLAQTAFCFYGTANLLFESPFLASLFWAFMGLGFRMARMLDVEKRSMRFSHGH